MLEALVAARTGTQGLTSLLLRDFHRRLGMYTPGTIHLDFFCMCLKSFYSARTVPVDIEKYQKDIDAFTIGVLPRLKPEHRLTLTSCYSTIGNRDIVGRLMETLRYSEAKQLNLRG